MRIALVTSEYITEDNFDGGLSNYVHRTALALRNFGLVPIVFTLSSKNENIEHDEINLFRVKIADTNLFNQSESWLLQRLRYSHYLLNRSWILNRKLKQVHDEKPFDVVQYANLGGLGLFRLKKIPSVTRISSYTPLINEAYSYSKGRAQNTWEMLAIKRSDGVFCPSNLIGKLVAEKFNVDVKIIESPYLKEKLIYDERAYEKNLKGKKYLLFFGTIGLLKGVSSIAEIIEELLSKYLDLHFTFVGKEADGLYHGMKMMEYVYQRSGKHKDRVIHLDKMHHDKLYPIIQNAHAVILPSRIDNFPNACIEAMAHHKVVIGTYKTSFEQLIQDGISGFLCEIDDPRSLFNAIEKVLNLEKDELKVIGDRAREKVDELRPEISISKLVSFYRDVISRNS